MFQQPYNLLVYSAALVVLLLGVWCGTTIPLFFQCTLFLVWDLLFAISRNPKDSEDRDTAITRSTTIGTLLSYFFPFYTILFALIFVTEKAKQTAFLELCIQANVPMWLLLTPFVLSSINLIFVPVAVTNAENKQVSPAFKGMLFVLTLGQQCTVLIFAHCLLRIAYVLSGG